MTIIKNGCSECRGDYHTSTEQCETYECRGKEREFFNGEVGTGIFNFKEECINCEGFSLVDINGFCKEHFFNCIECEDGHNLIRGLECFACGNTKVKYFKENKKGGLKE